MKHSVAIVSMLRDEARWLREWVVYHQVLGVTKFYLFDHLSTDGPEHILSDFIANGTVYLERVTENNGRYDLLQVRMLDRGFKMAQKECRWVALLDADEFLVPKTTDSLVQFLQPFERYGSVGVNWMMFGSAGVEAVPADQTMIETLTRKGARTLSHNKHVKVIAQTLYTTSVSALHMVNHKPGYYTVNANKQRIKGPSDPSIPIDQIQINHYFCRDQLYTTTVKIPRRIGLGMTAEAIHAWEREMNTEKDLAIQRFIPPTKARLCLPPRFNYQAYLDPTRTSEKRESLLAMKRSSIGYKLVV